MEVKKIDFIKKYLTYVDKKVLQECKSLPILYVNVILYEKGILNT